MDPRMPSTAELIDQLVTYVNGLAPELRTFHPQDMPLFPVKVSTSVVTGTTIVTGSALPEDTEQVGEAMYLWIGQKNSKPVTATSADFFEVSKYVRSTVTAVMDASPTTTVLTGRYIGGTSLNDTTIADAWFNAVVPTDQKTIGTYETVMVRLDRWYSPYSVTPPSVGYEYGTSGPNPADQLLETAVYVWTAGAGINVVAANSFALVTTVPRETHVGSPTKTISATTHTFSGADIGAYISFTSATDVTATVPPDSDVNWPSNAEIHIEQSNVGKVSIVGGAGVTVNVAPVFVAATQAQYAVLTLKRTPAGANTWTLFGLLQQA